MPVILSGLQRTDSHMPVILSGLQHTDSHMPVILSRLQHTDSHKPTCLLCLGSDGVLVCSSPDECVPI